MSIWIRPERVFDGEGLAAGIGLCLEGDRIERIGPVPMGAEVRPLRGTVTPGYVDLQVNGGGDVLLNRDPTVAGMERVAAAHRRYGTVAILPTIITDLPEVMTRFAEAAIEARGRRGLIGVHIEGPHISVPRRGTHAERFIRPMDETTINLVRGLRGAGVPVMITLAPEAVAPGQVAALAATGAVVSIGHSDASAEAVRALLAEGARCFTHLFNAMSPMLNRAPGVTGAAINSTAHCGIICDGIHVADEMVGLALRARPVSDRMFLVSDAMPTVGGSGRFRLYDMEIHVEDGRLVNSEGSLAGAHVTMAESVARLVRVVGADLATALRMAVTVPARLMGRGDLAGLVGRDAGEILVLDAGLQVTGTLASVLEASRVPG